jgi:predicted nucleotidyltransferase
VDDFALTSAERALLLALSRRGVRYIVVGLGAAVLQGAPMSTQDVDLWIERPGDDPVRQAAADAGGFWLPPNGMQPPAFGGEGLERVDVVLTAHGLEDFATEYALALDQDIDGIPVKVLPLERIIASKRATNRPKDLAALPALEATLRARDDGR